MHYMIILVLIILIFLNSNKQETNLFCAQNSRYKIHYKKNDMT